ncbi:anthrone oxygenase family protein [Reichenbachiella ulvae]|uniref:DUF1772 domain-containing protein n=1 Tax=Reichenbachiella ulvae TaxID=2980104 RepID=A0ABT3CVA9_9BACT|nr:anthrone oxygenase family protein [Reichenbachiella ulvae]MCV9387636.1 DUF1772 domain-containing protein [Reichenbachiella ulvae]
MKSISVVLALFSTGLMAGIFFTWTNAVKPGIGQLDDYIYLSSLQSMNREILNPMFYFAFILPIVSLPVSAALNYGSHGTYDFKILLLATAIYWIGAFLVTILGNIPLNEMLDAVDLEELKTEDWSVMRKKIEDKWNRYNLIRTLASIASFALIIWSLLRK